MLRFSDKPQEGHLVGKILKEFSISIEVHSNANDVMTIFQIVCARIRSVVRDKINIVASPAIYKLLRDQANLIIRE